MMGALMLQVSACGKDNGSSSSTSTDDNKGGSEETATTNQLTFFQLNLWEGLQNINDGYNTFYNQLISLMPDVASFCEFPAQGTETTAGPYAEYLLKQAIDKIYAKTGVQYYKTSMTGSGTRGVLTRYKIVEGATKVASTKSPNYQIWYYRTVIDFKGQEIAIYSSHSTPDYYACYLPRGYGDGSSPYTWAKLASGPITDLDLIKSRDVLGDRVQLAIDLYNDTKTQAAKGRLCIFGGDLNQPSHLDWTEATKNKFEHSGMVVPWSVSEYLLSNGFSDAYRTVYPDPVKYPGITWPVYNKDAKKTTAWAPEADERDRIDFVYFLNNDKIKVKKAQMVGPDCTMEYGKKSQDTFVNKSEELILPTNDTWASDHRGLFITFDISSK